MMWGMRRGPRGGAYSPETWAQMFVTEAGVDEKGSAVCWGSSGWYETLGFMKAARMWKSEASESNCTKVQMLPNALDSICG
jgi:hypothetical protein